MRTTFFYTILLLVLGTYLGCHKDLPDQDCPPGLPCATQTGENTFGCYINGQPWVAQVAHIFLTRPYINYKDGLMSQNMALITSTFCKFMLHQLIHLHTIYLLCLLGL